MARRRKSSPKPGRARPSAVARAERTEFEKLKNGFLDTAQSEAADRFHDLVVCAQRVGFAADPARPRVDGGKGYYEVPDAVLDAHNRLAAARSHLGHVSTALVYKFTCEGLTAAQIAAQAGESGDRAERYYRRRFRDALGELVELWFPKVAGRSRHGSFVRTGVAKVDRGEWG